MVRGPSIDRAASSGDIWTPLDFKAAVIRKFGPLSVDLACGINSRPMARCFITPEQDSLQQNWAKVLAGGRGWDNPPYSHITPWATKHALEWERGAETLLLVPGSIGANWYWEWVEPYAQVYSVGRMVFDNCFDRRTGKPVRTSYPKDLILCHYLPGVHPGIMKRWRWEEQ